MSSPSRLTRSRTAPFRVAFLAALFCAAALTQGCNKGSDKTSSSGGGGGDKTKIAVIPKGTTDPYWLSVKAGADAAAKDLNVDIVWKGTLKEDSTDDQVSLVEQFISSGVKGIVLAPLDGKALVRPVASAQQQNIPVVVIDSPLAGNPGTDYVSFIGTDNTNGGKMGGEALAKVLGGKGKIVLLRYRQGSVSTDQREAGFLDVVHKNPDLHMLVDNQYGGTTAGESQQAAMNLLDQIKNADGIFCPNESSTYGMLLALRQNNLAGKIHFVGFDATSRLIDALKKGEIDALVAQNPRKMGYEGVKAMVNKLNGKPVEPNIDSGATLITRDNLEDPAVKELLSGM